MMTIEIKTTTEDRVIELMYDLGYDFANYDVDAIVSDVENGARKLEDFTDFYDYNIYTIVRDSLINGQFRQAKLQCAEFGLDYELERYKFRQGEAE